MSFRGISRGILVFQVAGFLRFLAPLEMTDTGTDSVFGQPPEGGFETQIVSVENNQNHG